MKSLDRNTGDLLRAVVRTRAVDRGKRVIDPAAKITSWGETIEGARQHGVLPMLHAELRASSADVPQEALEFIRSEFERNAFHCIANAAELLEVLRAFEKDGIAAMPFKGVVLGASAYGDMTKRSAGDLDLLIFDRDLQRAARILRDRGYELTTEVLEDGSPKDAGSYEYHFERESDGMVLELRWRLELVEPRFRHSLGMDWVWPRRRIAKLAGADVPNLDPVSSLLVLCMHGSRHEWSRLMWICDVAKLLESEPGLDWEFARREAKRVGLWRCLSLGVLLAQGVAGARVPAEVLRSFEADRTARRLAEFFGRYVVEEPGRMPDGLIPYNVKILGIRSILSPAILRPNERDRALLKLPRALEPLYYLIRPFRILLDRTAR